VTRISAALCLFPSSSPSRFHCLSLFLSLSRSHTVTPLLVNTQICFVVLVFLLCTFPSSTRPMPGRGSGLPLPSLTARTLQQASVKQSTAAARAASTERETSKPDCSLNMYQPRNQYLSYKVSLLHQKGPSVVQASVSCGQKLSVRKKHERRSFVVDGLRDVETLYCTLQILFGNILLSSVSCCRQYLAITRPSTRTQHTCFSISPGYKWLKENLLHN